MAKADRPANQIVGEEDHVVHATWSRAGRNLILTVAVDADWDGYTQVLLTHPQADELGRFISAGPDSGE